jgi:hypothetical protein
MPDFASVTRPRVEAALESGETLEGGLRRHPAEHVQGRLTGAGHHRSPPAPGTLDRRGRPTDELISICPEDITDAKAQGAGGGWASIGPAVLDSAAVTIQLKTASGDKHKLTLMRGTGVFGKLDGGEAQQEGIEALAGWFQRCARQD